MFKRLAPRIGSLVVLLIFVFSSICPSVSAQTKQENDYLKALQAPLYEANSSCDPNASNEAAQAANGSLDISDVVNKYGLQSAMIMALGGNVVGSYKANQPPTTPASTMKLIIADVLLRSNADLGKTVSVGSDVYYDGHNDLGSGRVSLKTALEKTLEVSSNTGANVLMKALGGVDQFTEKAHSYDYSHTTVKGYYDPSNDGKNTSTISDQVKAMNHIFSTDGADYKIAQSALQTAAQNDNHYGVVDDANKWAGTSTVAGNVGKFKVGGKDYIIGLYINKSSSNPNAISAIKNGSADLAELAGNSASSSLSSAATCCSEGDAGNTVGAGGDDKGIWNSGLQPPYILEQWAIETLKDLAQKKGTSEADAVTKEHVVALVAFAIGEGGDIANGDLFNPLNTGIDDPQLVVGGHNASGLQSFKSFDAGVEAAARTLAKPQYARLATALLRPNSTARQFMYALSYNWKFPGGLIWAEASRSEPSYYQGRLALVSQVKSNYSNLAGLIIGTPAHEGIENKKDISKLQFAGGGGAATDDGAQCNASSADASAIVQMALLLSWPDNSHGTTPKPEYQKAYNRYNPDGPGIADCGGFVSTVMHATRADKDYPPGGTSLQAEYVRSSNKYNVVDKVNSFSELEPGDIMIVNAGSGGGGAGHTYIFVGSQPPHGFDVASASLNSRAANLGKGELHDARGNYLRARLK